MYLKYVNSLVFNQNCAKLNSWLIQASKAFIMRGVYKNLVSQFFVPSFRNEKTRSEAIQMHSGY